MERGKVKLNNPKRFQNYHHISDDKVGNAIKKACDKLLLFADVYRDKFPSNHCDSESFKYNLGENNNWTCGMLTGCYLLAYEFTKNEKFLVVSGKGVIRFKSPFDDQVIEYFVSGEKLEVVDIPTGYTHNIENIGDTDLLTIMWANETFDPSNPDTYFMEV